MAVMLSWLVLAAIHLLPALALVRPSLLSTLYGVERGSVGFLLLQHRAALFLAVLLICLWAAVRPEVRRLACAAVSLSMVSFLLLYLSAGSPSSLRIIAIADLLGLPFLVFLAWQAFRGEAAR